MNRKLSREIKFANKEHPGSPILLFDLRQRVQIRGACRLPQWLADWVMEEGDEGRKIEKALIEYYGLVPPANTVLISSRG